MDRTATVTRIGNVLGMNLDLALAGGFRTESRGRYPLQAHQTKQLKSRPTNEDLAVSYPLIHHLRLRN